MRRRELLRTLSTCAAAMPFLGAEAVLAQTPSDPYLKYVHPEFRAIAAQMLPMFANQPPPSLATLEQQRLTLKNFSAKPLPGVPYEKRIIPGPKGSPAVTVYIVNAGKPGARPALLHTHGGGYTAGSALGGLAGVQAMCRDIDCIAVSVDYRLAPETTYRGAIEDNYAALKWLHDNAQSLGADPARIAVVGESAGGGHAALLAITARDRGEVPLAFQCLIYPMLDDRTGTTRKVAAHVGKMIWTAESNRFGWQSFLGRPPGLGPAAGVPARTENLAGLPPAFIGVGTLDLFVDEDMDYAQRLNAAGVPTELIVVPGVFHAFDALPIASKVIDRFNTAKLAALKSGLGVV